MLNEHDQCTTLHFCPLCAARTAGAVGMLADDGQATHPTEPESITRDVTVGVIALGLFCATAMVANFIAGLMVGA